jgi:hypothetical protein
MTAAGLVAVLIWAAMMGFRSYVHYSLANRYSFQEGGWRKEAAGGRIRREDCLASADFSAQMAGKHRRAMWRPWVPVAPDPLYYFPPGARAYLRQQLARDPFYHLPPGAKAYLELERREAAKSHAEP